MSSWFKSLVTNSQQTSKILILWHISTACKDLRSLCYFYQQLLFIHANNVFNLFWFFFTCLSLSWGKCHSQQYFSQLITTHKCFRFLPTLRQMTSLAALLKRQQAAHQYLWALTGKHSSYMTIQSKFHC